jgi:hypothetical protein
VTRLRASQTRHCSIPVRDRVFTSFFRCVRTDPGVHSASYSVGIGAVFLADKVATHSQVTNGWRYSSTAPYALKEAVSFCSASCEDSFVQRRGSVFVEINPPCARTEGEWGNVDIVPLILNLDTRCMRMVSFTT